MSSALYQSPFDISKSLYKRSVSTPAMLETISMSSISKQLMIEVSIKNSRLKNWKILSKIKSKIARKL
jgi:hypothetical protein